MAIDPGIPRQMFWSEDVAGTKLCPKCGHGLINEHQIYVMVARQAGRIESFIAGTKSGFFCPECPVVVLAREGFNEFVRLGLGNLDPGQYTVLGLVDIDAIPTEKRHLPMGADGNPIPLVKFKNIANEPSERGKSCRTSTKKRQAKRKRR
ncbi:MAG: hypothetical protein AB9873_07800 [Syntrophobacteraceae bacterium]